MNLGHFILTIFLELFLWGTDSFVNGKSQAKYQNSKYYLIPSKLLNKLLLLLTAEYLNLTAVYNFLRIPASPADELDAAISIKVPYLLVWLIQNSF